MSYDNMPLQFCLWTENVSGCKHNEHEPKHYDKCPDCGKAIHVVPKLKPETRKAIRRNLQGFLDTCDNADLVELEL